MTRRNCYVDSVTDRIEQAVASLRSVEWMVEHLHVTPRQVFAVMERMDAAVRESDRTCPGAGRRKKAQR